MSKNIIPVNVTIFGKEYPVACPAGEEDGLRKSALRVDEEMRGIGKSGKVVDTDRIAVMVALNLAYELLRNQNNAVDNSAQPDVQSQQRINKMHQDIDAALAMHQANPLTKPPQES